MNPGARAAKCRTPEPELAGAPPTPAATRGACGSRRSGSLLGEGITLAALAARFVRRRGTVEPALSAPPTTVLSNVGLIDVSSALELIASAPEASVSTACSAGASRQLAPSEPRGANHEQSAPA